MEQHKKVAVALSGGVDSAVAAYLLKQQGYEVFGVHMNNWDRQINEFEDQGNCQGQKDSLMSKEVAKFLEIPLYFYNFTKEYWDDVFKPYLSDFENNLIGNPDLSCNSKIKFGILLDTVKKEFGSEVKLATGHYSNVTEENGIYYLETCKNTKKDQTYFLSRLTQDQLREIVFPLSEFESKSEVRELAKEIGLPNWDKKSSTGICFIGKREFISFVSSYVQGKEGQILDVEKTESLGKHKGLCYYSINQRKGTCVSGKSEKYYVCGKEERDSTLLVCRESVREKYLIKRGCLVNNLHWIYDSPKIGEKIFVKFKHTSNFVEGKIEDVDNHLVRLSHQPSCASTPGQYVVFYSIDKKRCLGSGTYHKSI
ncbi:tRNA (5-methylaminomethyl-2-thiouridylate)-methyltransferase [Mycoplasma ovis str. Michigan]|uniref:tRNA-uridine 2-sulfurtransferase n=1 Tax=Mycoplasma ovis str. Michigan TaxID=1415773 RepID=A0ABM5P0F2_9MOLU|nr:tRNA 2-thiouridine(34) synthase MnmA [Mycoplasma ovis]AHC39891.1 tRNA (5-methylaminomethyl-2-thiouridylate)-methyltransferase [Mycoplasma ovis str. Michigan]